MTKPEWTTRVAVERRAAAQDARRLVTPDLRQVLPHSVLHELEQRGIDVELLNADLRANGHDGCTIVSDWQVAACLMHDALYHTRIVSRAEADELFRIAMIALADQDDLWLWRWTGRARAYIRWAGVRAFGGWARSQREPTDPPPTPA